MKNSVLNYIIDRSLCFSEYNLVDRKEIDFSLLQSQIISHFNFDLRDVIDIGEDYVFLHSCFSSQIEGSNLSLEETKNFLKKGSFPITSSEVMVFDCAGAISQTLLAPAQAEGILPSQLVKTFHSALVTNDTKFKTKYIPGQYRKVQVYVGNCICPPPGMVEPYMDNFLFYLNKHPLSPVTAFLAHLYFALIHPFPDGNGRSARLIEFYLLLKAGVPVEYASRMAEQYMKNRIDYYYYLSEANSLQGNINFINFSFRLLDELINEEKPDKNKTYFLLEEKK